MFCWFIFYQTSTEPLYVRMWAFMSTQVPSVLVKSNEEGVRRVRTGNYAFFVESTTNTYINQRAPCDTKRVVETTNDYMTAVRYKRICMSSPQDTAAEHLSHRR